MPCENVLANFSVVCISNGTGSTRRAKSRMVVSTLCPSCQQGHLHLFPWGTSGIDSCIFIASPGKFSPRECCSHNSCPVSLVHHTSCSDIRSFIHSLPDHIPRSDSGHVQLTRLGTSIFVNISLSEGVFHVGETLKFEFMTSYTCWGAIYCCSIHLHLPSWHTSSAVSLWQKKKWMIYLPDTLGPPKTLVKEKLTCIWGSRSERGKKEKNGPSYLIQNPFEVYRVPFFSPISKWCQTIM